MALNRGTLLFLTGLFVIIFIISGADEHSRHVEASANPRLPRLLDTKAFPDDKYQRLFHFVQVTDVHVSMYSDPERMNDFRTFINETLLQVIKPPVVIMSGDIVDSLGETYLSSKQNVEEWTMYKKILQETMVKEKLQWLDIRGNHDNLNLASPDSENNYYKVYSVRGPEYNHSYKYVHQKGDEKIAFVGVDTCMDPGSRRPFNFFGQLTQERYDELLRLKDEVKDANYTVWFGHHPSSVVFSRARQGGIRDLYSNSGPYLCGHYHTVFNMVSRMFYYHAAKHALELELGDFKRERMFRVLSIDNGLLNFVDTKLDQYPIILVTNPKNALFHLPEYEPIERIERSTHIRVLVFSNQPVIEVRVRIDNQEEMMDLQQVDKTPLWLAPWKADDYKAGLHDICVVAEDGNGRKAEVSFKFSLDGSKPSFDLLARMALNITRPILGGILIVLVILAVVPLVVLRVRYSSNIGCYLSKERSASCFCRITFQMALLSSIDRLFYPLIIYPFYVCLGPWFVGYMLDGHLSICFLWGSYFYGSYIPGGIIFFYAILLLLVYFLPFQLLLSFVLYQTFANHFHTNLPPSQRGPYWLLRTVLILIVLLFQGLWASWFWFAFGGVAVALGVVPTGSIIFTMVMWRIAAVTPRNLFCVSKDLTDSGSGRTSTFGLTQESKDSNEQGPLVAKDVMLTLKEN